MNRTLVNRLGELFVHAESDSEAQVLVELCAKYAGLNTLLRQKDLTIELELRRLYKASIPQPYDKKVFYNKFELIKYHRAATGSGLKESKDFIENMFGL